MTYTVLVPDNGHPSARDVLNADQVATLEKVQQQQLELMKAQPTGAELEAACDSLLTQLEKDCD